MVTNKNSHIWCRLSGPGRGDCEHFIGLPDKIDDSATDEYGIPFGWCEWCWLVFKFEELNKVYKNAKAVVQHWNEFGPEYGHEEHVDSLEKSIKKYHEAIGTKDAPANLRTAGHQPTEQSKTQPEICPHYFEATDGVHACVVGQCACHGNLSGVR